MIVSGDNDRLKLVRKLRERKWRDRENAFVTEGEDLLASGIDAGWAPLDVLVAPDCGIDGTEVEPHLLDAASTLGSGTRVIAVWRMPARSEGGDGAFVYLHGASDPGNVGTIVRTAAALAGATVVLGGGSADPFSPKAARATMGALFLHPPVRGDLESTPTPRLALVASGGDDLDQAIMRLAATPTLCLGSERGGLSEDVLAKCDARATIPLSSGSESLNVAAAAAIGLQRISSLRVAESG